MEPASPPPEASGRAVSSSRRRSRDEQQARRAHRGPHAAAVQAQDLARSAAQSLEAKDFDRARSLLERARKLCAKGRERRRTVTACCSMCRISWLALHETQGHLAEAMGEYERAVKQAPTVNGKAREKSAVQDAVLRLVPKLGILIMPKQSGAPAKRSRCG